MTDSNATCNEKLTAEDKILGRTTWSVVGLTGGALSLIMLLVWLTLSERLTAGSFIQTMRWYVAGIIAVAGTMTLGAVFIKMKRGIRQQNLRALGVVLIAVLVSLVAVASGRYEPAFGILGAIAGYLFGKDKAADGEKDGGGCHRSFKDLPVIPPRWCSG